MAWRKDMPTGYTDAVRDGITFEQFVLGCARGMGALVMMRDEPSGTPIPERFEPSPFYLNELNKANAELAELLVMTIEQAQLREVAENAESERCRLEELERNRHTIASYRAMLEQVRAWVPPSEEHVHFKEFMISQLEQSIQHDDSEKYLLERTPMLSGYVWRERKIGVARGKVERYTEEYAKEVARTEARNTWIRQLRESLEVQP